MSTEKELVLYFANQTLEFVNKLPIDDLQRALALNAATIEILSSLADLDLDWSEEHGGD